MIQNIGNQSIELQLLVSGSDFLPKPHSSIWSDLSSLLLIRRLFPLSFLSDIIGLIFPLYLSFFSLFNQLNKRRVKLTMKEEPSESETTSEWLFDPFSDSTGDQTTLSFHLENFIDSLIVDFPLFLPQRLIHLPSFIHQKEEKRREEKRRERRKGRKLKSEKGKEWMYEEIPQPTLLVGHRV